MGLRGLSNWPEFLSLSISKPDYKTFFCLNTKLSLLYRTFLRIPKHDSQSVSEQYVKYKVDEILKQRVNFGFWSWRNCGDAIISWCRHANNWTKAVSIFRYWMIDSWTIYFRECKQIKWILMMMMHFLWEPSSGHGVG